MQQFNFCFRFNKTAQILLKKPLLRNLPQIHSGKKIQCFKELPSNEPFIFFDTDTLICGNPSERSFDFSKPSVSLRHEKTPHALKLYWPGYGEIWRSLSEMFDLDFESPLDRWHLYEYWKWYPYLNAGFFYNEYPKILAERFTEFAVEISVQWL